MSASIKGTLKLLTPKFVILFFKNSLFLKLKQFLIKSSTRFVVLSHKPWRHRMRWIKVSSAKSILKAIQLYTQSPLWVRTAIAIGLLFVTASSSYVIIALLIIPQPILTWLKNLLVSILNRTGVTHLLKTFWRLLIPAPVQHSWYMHRKWTLGRRQVITAKRLRDTIITTAKQSMKNDPNKRDDDRSE